MSHLGHSLGEFYPLQRFSQYILQPQPTGTKKVDDYAQGFSFKRMTNKLYVSRKERGRGLTSIEDCIVASTQGLDDVIKKGQERLITAAKSSIGNIITNRETKASKEKGKKKQLYRYFKPQTYDIAHKKTWIWLKRRNLKNGTESRIITAENNAIRTDYIVVKIDKALQNCKCRLCGDKNATVNYIGSECKLEPKGLARQGG